MMEHLPSTLSLAGKVAIVTGSSRSIGEGLARELASRGAKVAICYTSESSTSKAQELANEINATSPGDACIIQANLADVDCGKKIIEGTLKGFNTNTIDILVNNAAGGPAVFPANEFDAAGFDEAMHINVRAPMLLVKELLPHLPKKGGRIINISSVITRFPVATRNMYAASKGALDILTQQWAAELSRQYNCTVNGVRIGPTVTEASKVVVGVDKARDEARAKVIERTSAAARLGEVDDHAQVVAWLASEGSRWVNGQTINSNGGSVFM